MAVELAGAGRRATPLGMEAENGLLRRRVRWMGRVGVASLAGLLIAVATGASVLDNNPEIKPGQIIVKDPGGSKSAVVLNATDRRHCRPGYL